RGDHRVGMPGLPFPSSIQEAFQYSPRCTEPLHLDISASYRNQQTPTQEPAMVTCISSRRRFFSHDNDKFTGIVGAKMNLVAAKGSLGSRVLNTVVDVEYKVQWLSRLRDFERSDYSASITFRLDEFVHILAVN